MLVIGVMVVVVPTVSVTSVKMDFLPYADVRVDPIVDPECLADHVHTFYGGVPSIGVRPETTFQDLRDGTQNSGNVEENKSMYWMPTVYRVDTKNDGTKRYVKAPIWFSSAYYVWDAEVKDVKAFPEGFKMIARAGNPKSRTFFECVDPSPCRRGERNCRRADPETDFPRSACWELEVSIIFPSCWDGVNVDSDDHMSHVAYTDDGYADGECPESHPISIPQLHCIGASTNMREGDTNSRTARRKCMSTTSQDGVKRTCSVSSTIARIPPSMRCLMLGVRSTSHF